MRHGLFLFEHCFPSRCPRTECQPVAGSVLCFLRGVRVLFAPPPVFVSGPLGTCGAPGKRPQAFVEDVLRRGHIRPQGMALKAQEIPPFPEKYANILFLSREVWSHPRESFCWQADFVCFVMGCLRLEVAAYERVWWMRPFRQILGDTAEAGSRAS